MNLHVEDATRDSFLLNVVLELEQLLGSCPHRYPVYLQVIQALRLVLEFKNVLNWLLGCILLAPSLHVPLKNLLQCEE